ncbi:MAG: SlyX family protein [Rhodobacterales bacterium]|nr:SlyX family protein [Rhodobacterales bacterium]
MTEHRQNLEERIAHLIRVVDDLSDIVAAQQRQLEVMERRLAMVMQREAQREVAEGGTVPLADQRPPHW